MSSSPAYNSVTFASEVSVTRRRGRGRATGIVAALVAASMVSALTLAPTLAFADGANGEPAIVETHAAADGEDVVYLRDGTSLKGSILELLPGDHASLKLSTGQIANIRWEGIARVERASKGQQPPPPKATAVRTAGAGQALVHIDSDTQVTLEARPTGTYGRREGNSAWQNVCDSPCDRALDLDQEYRVAGGGVRPSAPFRLVSDAGGRVTISVDAASSGARAGGIVLVSLGSVATFIGLIVMAVGGILNGANGSGDGPLIGGAVTTTLGIGGIIGGAVLIGSNRQTKTSQFDGNAPAASSSLAPSRTPAWNDGRMSATGPQPLPRVPTATIFSASF